MFVHKMVKAHKNNMFLSTCDVYMYIYIHTHTHNYMQLSTE